MPLSNTIVPLFPTVPQVPGVPALLRKAGQANSAVVLLVADALIIANMFDPPQWGLYTQGKAPALVPDSVIRLSFRAEARISNAPQEKGAFMSYNKVQDPFNGRITCVIGGTNQNRLSFLNACEAARQSLGLYDLVMPEIVKVNVNVVHYDFERTSEHGVSMLTVDIWVEEVRIVSGPAFSTTAPTATPADPTAAPTQNGGQVSPAPAGAGGTAIGYM